MHVPKPVISLAVEPKNKSDIDKLGKALPPPPSPIYTSHSHPPARNYPQGSMHAP